MLREWYKNFRNQCSNQSINQPIRSRTHLKIVFRWWWHHIIQYWTGWITVSHWTLVWCLNVYYSIATKLAYFQKEKAIASSQLLSSNELLAKNTLFFVIILHMYLKLSALKTECYFQELIGIDPVLCGYTVAVLLTVVHCNKTLFISECSCWYL